MKSLIYFRADGNAEIGLGHVFRLLALADMLKHRFNCVFLIGKQCITAIEIVEACGYEVVSVKETKKKVEEAENLLKLQKKARNIIVLDGYEFDVKYQSILGQNDNVVVLVSDYPSEKTVADLVINHAGGISYQDYNGMIYTKYCLGPSYSMLRSAFRLKSTKCEPGFAVKKLFVCFGGADPANCTIKVLSAVLQLDFFKAIVVVIGQAYSHKKELESLFTHHPKLSLYEGIDATKMADLIHDSLVAICPSSTIAYEVCTVGSGLISGIVADNQKGINRFLDKEELAFSVGDFREIGTEELSEKILEYIKKEFWSVNIKRQNQVFTKEVSKNFELVFDKVIQASTIKIRKATSKDMLLIYNWANDTEARLNATTTAQIPLSEHKAWFSKKIKDSNTYLYILEFDSNPIAQVRYERENDYYVISYSVDIKFRGRGLGELVLVKSLKKLYMDHGDSPKIYAIVKRENRRSAKIFINNYFKLSGEKSYDGSKFDVYIKA